LNFIDLTFVILVLEFKYTLSPHDYIRTNIRSIKR
jgi:hypothetical protein